MLFKIFLLVMLFVSSCAPVNREALAPGISEAPAPGQVEINVVVGFLDTQKYCWSNMPAYQLALNLFFNFGITAGCSTVYVDAAGKVKKCDVFLAFDFDSLRDHEVGHCEGAADYY